MPRVVAIHGAPRSGTTWLGQIFNSSPQVAYRYQPFFSYAFRDRIDEESSPDEMHNFFADLLDSKDEFLLQIGNARLSRQNPDFFKSATSLLVYKEVRFHHLLPHLLEALPNLRSLGLVRDPRYVIASWFAAPREFKASWDLRAEWRYADLKNNHSKENWYGFERWKELTILFMKLEDKYPNRFRIIRYEDLVRTPHRVVCQAFEFCDLPLAAQTTQFISESTSRDDADPYGVYRIRSRTDHLRLGNEIEGQILTELKGTAFERFLGEPKE